MKKIVDGVLVTMPAGEAAAMQAEWDATAARKAAEAAQPKEPTLEERLAAIEDWAALETLAVPK